MKKLDEMVRTSVSSVAEKLEKTKSDAAEMLKTEIDGLSTSSAQQFKDMRFTLKTNEENVSKRVDELNKRTEATFQAFELRMDSWSGLSDRGWPQSRRT